MAFELGNNIKQTTNTIGTGPFTLIAAPAGSNNFSPQIATGALTIYTRWNGTTPAEIEVGVGVLTTPTLITPSHPTIPLLYSTNGGGLVPWSGTQNVVCGIPAKAFVWLLDPAGALGLVERTAAWPPAYAAVVMTSLARSLLGDAGTGAMQIRIGGTTVGRALFVAASQAAARTALGSLAFGDSLFATANAPAAKTLLAYTASEIGFATPVSPLSGGNTKAVVDSAGTILAAIQIQLANNLSKVPYSSGAQVISSTPLTLSHGLGVVPKVVTAWLTCVTAEENYVVGEKFPVNVGPANSGDNGIVVRVTSTQLKVTFGAASPIFRSLNLTGRDTVGLTNDRWTIELFAYA